MWSIGTQEYIDGLIEYSSWALFQAFPNAFIYDVYGARDVLREMAAPHDRGADFRSFIAYTGSTFIGRNATMLENQCLFVFHMLNNVKMSFYI
jgi:hypothetical protein